MQASKGGIWMSEKIGSFFQWFVGFLKNKYRIIAFILVLCIVAFFTCRWAANEILYYKYGMWEEEVKDFGDNKHGFELLAKNLYVYFENEYWNNDQLQCVLVQPMDKEWVIKYFYKDTEAEKQETKMMTADETESIQIVREALLRKDGGFNSIFLNFNAVIFSTLSPYSVIWAKDGKKPESFTVKNRDIAVVSKRLSLSSDKWYQCVCIP